MKLDDIIAPALAGLPNAEIAALVGSRPRKVREIVSAAIRAGVPIAPNADRVASRRASDGAPEAVPASPLGD